MFPQYLLTPFGHFPRSNMLPPNQPSGFVTKSIHLLIISLHAYKMNIGTKFTMWVSLFLTEYIFPEYILNVFSSPYTNTWPLKSIEPGQVACLQPVCSTGIQGLVSSITDEFSLFYEISPGKLTRIELWVSSSSASQSTFFDLLLCLAFRKPKI